MSCHVTERCPQNQLVVSGTCAEASPADKKRVWTVPQRHPNGILGPQIHVGQESYTDLDGSTAGIEASAKTTRRILLRPTILNKLHWRYSETDIFHVEMASKKVHRRSGLQPLQYFILKTMGN